MDDLEEDSTERNSDSVREGNRPFPDLMAQPKADSCKALDQGQPAEIMRRAERITDGAPLSHHSIQIGECGQFGLSARESSRQRRAEQYPYTTRSCTPRFPLSVAYKSFN